MVNIVGLKNLCPPALFYLVLSGITILIMVIQNYSTADDMYCLGNYTCSGNKVAIILTSIVYALFWTWVLNLICDAGASYISWILVLLPFLLFFISLVVLIFMKM